MEEENVLTLDLFCNSIKQNEGADSREEGIVERDPTLFGHASRVSGDPLSQVWQKRVSVRAGGETRARLLSFVQRGQSDADGLYPCLSAERGEGGDGGLFEILGAWGKAFAAKFGADGAEKEGKG